MTKRTQKLRHNVRPASQIVQCEICGGNYNRSYLVSHTRLAHKKVNTSAAGINENEGLERILAIYDRLPSEKKKLVLDRLSDSLRD